MILLGLILIGVGLALALTTPFLRAGELGVVLLIVGLILIIVAVVDVNGDAHAATAGVLLLPGRLRDWLACAFYDAVALLERVLRHDGPRVNAGGHGWTKPVAPPAASTRPLPHPIDACTCGLTHARGGAPGVHASGCAVRSRARRNGIAAVGR